MFQWSLRGEILLLRSYPGCASLFAFPDAPAVMQTIATPSPFLQSRIKLRGFAEPKRVCDRHCPQATHSDSSCSYHDFIRCAGVETFVQAALEGQREQVLGMRQNCMLNINAPNHTNLNAMGIACSQGNKPAFHILIEACLLYTSPSPRDS